MQEPTSTAPYRNNIGADGAAALAERLKSCNNLQALHLYRNNIGADGAAALAERLKSCNNLQALYLNRNNIGADGAAALAEGLKSCKHCTSIGTILVLMVQQL